MSEKSGAIGTKVGRVVGNQAAELTTIFVVLKLIGVIDWSWWLVLLPTWATFAVARGLLGLVTLLTDQERS
jgi:hypothetical protein